MVVALRILVLGAFAILMTGCNPGGDSGGDEESVLSKTKVLHSDTFISNWKNESRGDDGVETWFSFLIENEAGYDALEEAIDSVELLLDGGNDRRDIPFDIVNVYEDNDEGTKFQVSFWALARDEPDRFFVNNNSIVLTDVEGNEFRYDFSLTLSESVANLNPDFVYRSEYQGDTQFGYPALEFLTVSDIVIDSDSVNFKFNYSDDRIKIAYVYFVNEDSSGEFEDVYRVDVDLDNMIEGTAYDESYFFTGDQVTIFNEGISVDDVSRISVIGMTEKVPFFEGYYSDEPWMRSIIYYQSITK